QRLTFVLVFTATMTSGLGSGKEADFSDPSLAAALDKIKNKDNKENFVCYGFEGKLCFQNLVHCVVCKGKRRKRCWLRRAMAGWLRWSRVWTKRVCSLLCSALS